MVVTAAPVARFICHCEICQAYTGKPFSDVTVLRARDVDMSAARSVVYRKYRLPPNIERGSCHVCGKPVIEFGLAGPAKLAFLPTGNYADTSTLPPASLHMFYHRRVSDIHDDLPKHSGYFASQLAVVGLLFGGLTAKAKPSEH
ncbi:MULTISPECIES: GFA family protein [unclassified Variovorax]|uniref:GFA family protein n=1 Tax=unclassified Variovorax TaxID=663243 RepID=UPI001BD4BF3D|nr:MULTISPECIES: GFA family protein [unclassified Variovorax]